MFLQKAESNVCFAPYAKHDCVKYRYFGLIFEYQWQSRDVALHVDYNYLHTIAVKAKKKKNKIFPTTIKKKHLFYMEWKDRS